MEDKYALALEALRDTVAGLEGVDARVSAQAADLFLEQQSALIPDLGVDRQLMAKALFVATAVLLATRDNSADDVHHLIDVEDSGGSCEEPDCEFDHGDDLDTSYLGGQIDGMDSMIVAMAGMALAVADSEGVDFDNIDWTQAAPPRATHQSEQTEGSTDGEEQPA